MPSHLGMSHCDRGHPYTPENTRITTRGRRKCRECERIGERARRTGSTSAADRQAAKRARDKRRALVDSLKLASGCIDCGFAGPSVALQFDHVRGVKSFDVGANRRYSLARLYEEITKCEVVCANCHAIRTDKRRTDA